jgi:hypothetical protein
MEKMHLPDFQTADERTEYIKSNADYFTLVYRRGRRNIRLEYKTLDGARAGARAAADFMNQNVIIYAVICPFSEVSEPYGYSSWIETIKPIGQK